MRRIALALSRQDDLIIAIFLCQDSLDVLFKTVFRVPGRERSPGLGLIARLSRRAPAQRVARETRRRNEREDALYEEEGAENIEECVHSRSAQSFPK